MCHILMLFCMSRADIFEIEPEISAKVACEIFCINFTCPIDENVTPHSTLKLKMALEYEIVMGGGWEDT